MKSTYSFLFDNCSELYQREFQVEGQEAVASNPDQDGPSVKNLDFWHKHIALIVSVIEEDQKSYSPVLNQFPQDLNVGQVSAHSMWTLFSEDLKIALQGMFRMKKKYVLFQYSITQEDITYVNAQT